MTDIYEVGVGKCYISKTRGVKVLVTSICQHAMDCSVSMVCYRNLNPTSDYPANTKWVIEESVFLKRFKE